MGRVEGDDVAPRDSICSKGKSTATAGSASSNLAASGSVRFFTVFVSIVCNLDNDSKGAADSHTKQITFGWNDKTLSEERMWPGFQQKPPPFLRKKTAAARET